MVKRIKKRILSIALKILRSYFRNTKYSVFIFDREHKVIDPFLWHPRYLPKKDFQSTSSITNDWINFEDKLSYKGKIVFDVGAAIGATSRLFSKTAKKVYSFEPNIDNYNTLNDIIYLEKIDNIETFNLAVSNQNSELTFYNRESHGIHSLGKHPKGKIINTSKISSIRLDDFYESNFTNNEEISILKIDTEGFEYEVLDGSKNLLKKRIIKAIIFEHSESLLRTLGKDHKLIFKLLEKYNYQVYDYDGNLFDFKKDSCRKISDFLALADR